MSQPAATKKPSRRIDKAISLEPTWVGFIQNADDALKLCEACWSGRLNLARRRADKSEVRTLVRAGNVFVHEVVPGRESAGIQRWTDGVPWSPSRKVGEMTIYGELKGPKPLSSGPTVRKRRSAPSDTDDPEEEVDSLLYGALRGEGFDLRPNGLYKRTISVLSGGSEYRVIAYYCPGDVKQAWANLAQGVALPEKVRRPSDDVLLAGVEARQGASIKQPGDRARRPMPQRAQAAGVPGPMTTPIPVAIAPNVMPMQTLGDSVHGPPHLPLLGSAGYEPVYTPVHGMRQLRPMPEPSASVPMPGPYASEPARLEEPTAPGFMPGQNELWPSKMYTLGPSGMEAPPMYTFGANTAGSSSTCFLTDSPSGLTGYPDPGQQPGSEGLYDFSAGAPATATEFTGLPYYSAGTALGNGGETGGDVPGQSLSDSVYEDWESIIKDWEQ